MQVSHALEGFRTSLGNVTRGARGVLLSRSWISEGRGGHEWDSPGYPDEVRAYADQVRLVLAGALYEDRKARTVAEVSSGDTAVALLREVTRLRALGAKLLRSTREAEAMVSDTDESVRDAGDRINEALHEYIRGVDLIVKDRSSCPETEGEIRRAREEYSERAEMTPLPTAFRVLTEHDTPEGLLSVRKAPDDFDAAISLSKRVSCICHATPEEPSAKLLLLMGVGVGAGKTAVIPMSISEELPEHDNLARPQSCDESLEAAIFAVSYVSKVAAPGVLGALNRDIDLVHELRKDAAPAP